MRFRHRLHRPLTDAMTLGLLPVLAWQGKQVRKAIIDMPEAAGPRVGRTSPPNVSQAYENPAFPAFSLLVMGESTAAGVGAPTQDQALVGHLSANLAMTLNRPVQWRVLARSGLTAQGVRRHLVSQLPARTPRPLDLAVIVLGVNDTKDLTPPRRWRQHLLGLLDDLQQRCEPRQVLFTGVPTMGDFPAFPRPLRDVLGRRSVMMDRCLADVVADRANVAHAPFSLPIAAELFCADGVHPGPEGYRQWAGYLLDSLR